MAESPSRVAIPEPGRRPLVVSFLGVVGVGEMRGWGAHQFESSGSGEFAGEAADVARLRLQRRALPGAVPEIRTIVAGYFVRSLGISGARSADIQLAMTEACGNVVRHAYRVVRAMSFASVRRPMMRS